MQQNHTLPVLGFLAPLARFRSLWASVEYARATATEFAALNALSDAELAEMGLTRSVLRRHIRQKKTARSMLTSAGGWHDRHAQDHDTFQR